MTPLVINLEAGTYVVKFEGPRPEDVREEKYEVKSGGSPLRVRFEVMTAEKYFEEALKQPLAGRGSVR